MDLYEKIRVEIGEKWRRNSKEKDAVIKKIHKLESQSKNLELTFKENDLIEIYKNFFLMENTMNILNINRIKIRLMHLRIEFLDLFFTKIILKCQHLLKVKGWPNYTVNSKDVIPDTVHEFSEITKLISNFLDIQQFITPKEDKYDILLINLLTDPFEIRFNYHFNRDQKTNDLSKPSILFRQTVSWIESIINFEKLIFSGLHFNVNPKKAILSLFDELLSQKIENVFNNDDYENSMKWMDQILEHILFIKNLDNTFFCFEKIFQNENFTQKWMKFENISIQTKWREISNQIYSKVPFFNNWHDNVKIDNYSLPPVVNISRCYEFMFCLIDSFVERSSILPANYTPIYSKLVATLIETFCRHYVENVKEINSDHSIKTSVLEISAILNGMKYLKLFLSDIKVTINVQYLKNILNETEDYFIQFNYSFFTRNLMEDIADNVAKWNIKFVDDKCNEYSDDVVMLLNRIDNVMYLILSTVFQDYHNNLMFNLIFQLYSNLENQIFKGVPNLKKSRILKNNYFSGIQQLCDKHGVIELDQKIENIKERCMEGLEIAAVNRLHVLNCKLIVCSFHKIVRNVDASQKEMFKILMYEKLRNININISNLSIEDCWNVINVRQDVDILSSQLIIEYTSKNII
ncbi:hypothetical protein A3Q56_03510, partial [Intoshia linei]